MTDEDIVILPGESKPISKAKSPAKLRARYDAAQTTTENTAHWSAADYLSARSSNTPSIRRTLRARSRYETANNGYAAGITETLANYVIGTGPRLQLLTKDPQVNRRVEQLFSQWSRRTHYARKLWVMRFSSAVDGESFGVFSTNYASRDPVKLDLKVIEADRVADPRAVFNSQQLNDGIFYDDFGNPTAYTILREHPGDLGFLSANTEYDLVRAEFVVHLFKARRPEQVRGVPEMTPTMQLFADLRRYSASVLAAAETAANISAIGRSIAPPDTTSEGAPVPWEEVDIPRRSMLMLPDGYDITQLRAEQPTTTYSMFIEEKLGEAGRPFSMPLNIAMAKSAGYNFSSAKLDFAMFDKAIGIDQFRVEEDVCEPTLEQWFNEARMIAGYLPDGLDFSDGLPPHEWFWDGQEQLDPRENGSRATAIQYGIDTIPRIFAKKGLDYEVEQSAMAASLGMSVEEYRRRLAQNIFASQQVDEVTTEEDDDDA